ncbi:hypothetical protein N665_1003s0006 [Sinapis alba]|nr:hypothetical protein N665_1003s0006 [Sinapis alba]
MEARKGIICGLAACGEQGQSSKGNDVEEITITEFRHSQGYLIRIEELEEDIDPVFLHCMRALDARNSAPVRRPQQQLGQSSRGKGGRQN